MSVCAADVNVEACVERVSVEAVCVEAVCVCGACVCVEAFVWRCVCAAV